LLNSLEIRGLAIIEGLTIDFERGFIRAEVMSYDALIHGGSSQAVKEKGQLRIEGKEYTVKDGDALHALWTAVVWLTPPARDHAGVLSASGEGAAVNATIGAALLVGGAHVLSALGTCPT